MRQGALQTRDRHSLLRPAWKRKLPNGPETWRSDIHCQGGSQSKPQALANPGRSVRALPTWGHAYGPVILSALVFLRAKVSSFSPYYTNSLRVLLLTILLGVLSKTFSYVPCL